MQRRPTCPVAYHLWLLASCEREREKLLRYAEQDEALRGESLRAKAQRQLQNAEVQKHLARSAALRFPHCPHRVHVPNLPHVAVDGSEDHCDCTATH